MELYLAAVILIATAIIFIKESLSKNRRTLLLAVLGIIFVMILLYIVATLLLLRAI